MSYTCRSILDQVNMQAVDTAGVEPMAHPLGGAQRLRDDAVTVADERAVNLANAPAQQVAFVHGWPRQAGPPPLAMDSRTSTGISGRRRFSGSPPSA